MYEFSHDTIKHPNSDELYIRCAHLDEYGTSTTGISITPEALPELIAYLQTITVQEVAS